MIKKMSKKAFTLIEVIVVVAIIGILVLLGVPRLTGYVQEAQLTRIQHDVKVMEQEMNNVLTADNNFNDWQNNGKDLNRVIMRKELYEKQGVAKNLDWEHLSAKWVQANKGGNQLASKDSELGVGGNLIELDDKYSTYKIIPKEYSSEINTKLKGTFYVNSLGKVYYEHDKSLGGTTEKESLACETPSTLGYEFEIISGLGTIIGWNGNTTHLVIPSAFKMSEGGKEWCEPVRVIGAGAFQNGTFEKVTIPQSVEEIQDDAFRGGELIEIEIPHSVKVIGDNAFTDNPVTSSGEDSDSGGSDGSSGGSGGADESRVVVKGSSSERDISDSAFGGLIPNYSHVTDKDLGVITETKNNGGKTVSIIGKTVTSDSSSNNSNTVINIPKELEIDGEILPVTEIEKGAFQGSGLIDVIMPEGLLYIHDYAFAGNQLVRVVIPNSVIEVGNYAFAYNEIASKPTIDPINILESKFSGDFGHVDNEGNISQPVSTIDLKAHVFIISSMGNHVIEDIGANPGQTEGNDGDIGNNDGLMNPIKPRKPIEGEIPIATAEELAKIGQPGEESEYPLDGKYILTANIDLSGYSEGAGWIPIGSYTSSTDKSPFKGSFDGNGYKITNLTIDKPSQNYVGLFGYTEGATISNVALEGINVTGYRYVGGLVGWSNKSTIRNSYTTGTVTGKDNVGGVVGQAYQGTNINNSYATGTVTGADYVGGLVGYSSGSTIENSYSTSSVKDSGNYVGGLVGNASGGTISNSYSTGSVTGSDRVGGLVGTAISNITIEKSYATGSVTGRGYSAGGLVGWAGNSTTISNSYATGKVTGSGTQVGGLVGYTQASNISNSYATGSVEGSGSYVGGLVGQTSNSTIEKSYAIGSVISAGRYVGGLVGYAYNGTRISNSYWDKGTTKQSTSDGGEGKSTNDMKLKGTYKDWDFINVWDIVNGEYPKLR